MIAKLELIRQIESFAADYGLLKAETTISELIERLLEEIIRENN